MPYDYLNELSSVKSYYDKDPLQKRFSAIICGNIGVGKTFLLRTARKPIHIDSFDPGGTKCLRDEIARGDIFVDTRWEAEDPFKPWVWAEWMKATNMRIEIDYFKHFGTYAIDTSTKWMESAMNYQLSAADRAAEAPKWSYDYVPTKVQMVNYISKLMNLPCDFILNGHFRENRELLAVDKKTGIKTEHIEYRYLTIGQAAITIPLMFDEIYVLQAEESARGYDRVLITEAQGKYLARSRLKADGKLDIEEPADIKALLKKIGIDWEDKEKIELKGGEEESSDD